MAGSHDSSLFYANVPSTLSTDTYDAVYERMVNQGTTSVDLGVRSGLLSFTDQMARVTEHGDPHYFLFTANSAIPVGDAVRGYYDQMERICPPLGYIDVKSKLQSKSAEVQEEHVTREYARLTPIIGGLGKVAVVDQFVSSGFSINMARWIIYEAGAHSSVDIRGNWYHDAVPAEIDLRQTTSIHAEFMYKVGRDSAARVQKGAYNKKAPAIVISAPSNSES